MNGDSGWYLGRWTRRFTKNIIWSSTTNRQIDLKTTRGFGVEDAWSPGQGASGRYITIQTQVVPLPRNTLNVGRPMHELLVAA